MLTDICAVFVGTHTFATFGITMGLHLDTVHYPSSCTHKVIVIPYLALTYQANSSSYPQQDGKRVLVKVQ